jgi:hypothetical protein
MEVLETQLSAQDVIVIEEEDGDLGRLVREHENDLEPDLLEEKEIALEALGGEVDEWEAVQLMKGSRRNRKLVGLSGNQRVSVPSDEQVKIPKDPDPNQCYSALIDHVIAAHQSRDQLNEEIKELSREMEALNAVISIEESEIQTGSFEVRSCQQGCV